MRDAAGLVAAGTHDALAAIGKLRAGRRRRHDEAARSTRAGPFAIMRRSKIVPQLVLNEQRMQTREIRRCDARASARVAQNIGKSEAGVDAEFVREQMADTGSAQVARI